MPPSGYDGMNGGYAPPGATAPLPHIEDMVAFPQDINRNQPMKHLLDLAETTLAKSEMSRDFGKPALAFKDYVKASVLAVQIIPSHSDYVELKSSRTDWNRRHAGLLKRISQQSDVYDKIKRDIIADNERTGVQPTVVPSTRQKASANALLSQSFPVKDASPTTRQPVDGQSEPHTNGSPGKVKPVVHPKPQSLAGHAIKPGHARAASAASATSSTQAMSDLAARFANLRGPQPSPGQDPRIKTHHIVPPPNKPAGPRDMPPPRPKISLDSAIPALPKMPDAIYSPARGSISGESARLPPSTPRGHFSRTGSAVSINSATSTPLPQQGSDYFSSLPQGPSRNGNVDTPQPPEGAFKVPEGDRITPEELFEAMKAKGSILIIDVRAREDFDEGHIMSSSTICIDPNVLSRPNISADEIAESLVLSPSQEQIQFERRASYDLVIFYDQYSEKIPSPHWNAEETPLASLHRALVHLSYGHELRNPPKLLKGGLEAWVDLMGAASLQSTVPLKPKKISLVRQSPFQRRPSQYLGKPLRPDIVKVWQQAVEIEEKETETATEQAFHRSTESFLRRFPSLSLQESMTSPAIAEHRTPGYGSSHQVDLYTDLPSPPTRPAPALPRLSYSSLSQTVDDHDMYHEPTPAAPALPLSEKVFYTGLNNPHNWCYANSTLQSLLASPNFGRELFNSEWVDKYQAPRKDDEKIDQPQLMIKIISNLFHWMTTGKFKSMKAQTLMDYSLHLCQHSQTISKFGGNGQQDAQEFMSFLLDYLHDETNSRRNLKGSIAQPNTIPQARLQAAIEYWENYQELNRSIVDRYWRGLELSTVDCQRCHKQTHTFSTFDLVFAPVGKNQDITLEDSFREHNVVNTLDNFACDSCKRNTKAMQTTCFARMPPLLCLSFRRFDFDKSVGDIKKSTRRVTWDFNEVDLSPYFMRTSENTSDRAFSGPFKYQCYAVIVHSGSKTDNGHYYAYVRDSNTHDQYAWYRCEDSQVTKVRIGTGDATDFKDNVFKSGRDTVPYLAFFRRKDS
ncbi:cysteine proteinase [Trichoderma ceciliae]